MPDSLIEELRRYGSKDPDLAKLARTDIPAFEAIRELRQRYPAAFTSAPPVPAAPDSVLATLSAQNLPKWTGEMERDFQAYARKIDGDEALAEFYKRHGINEEPAT